MRSHFPAFTHARKVRGWSQEEVARLLTLQLQPTGRTAVRAWERRGTRPCEDRLDALAEVFRVERVVVERWFGLEFILGGSHVAR